MFSIFNFCICFQQRHTPRDLASIPSNNTDSCFTVAGICWASHQGNELAYSFLRDWSSLCEGFFLGFHPLFRVPLELIQSGSPPASLLVFSSNYLAYLLQPQKKLRWAIEIWGEWNTLRDLSEMLCRMNFAILKRSRNKNCHLKFKWSYTGFFLPLICLSTILVGCIWLCGKRLLNSSSQAVFKGQKNFFSQNLRWFQMNLRCWFQKWHLLGPTMSSFRDTT